MSRLIDADKLVEEIEAFSMHITGSHHHNFIVSQCKNSIKRMIDEQPTVNVPDTKCLMEALLKADIKNVGDLSINYEEQMAAIEMMTRNKEWIPCSERLPEERDSMFKKLKGTDKWRNAMFEKISDNVNVTVEFEDGTRKSMKGYTVDGEWKPDTAVKCKVIAWMPLPEPYNPEGEKL